jgi:Lar family restriction alleviation protein
MGELKLCPFCGSKVLEMQHAIYGWWVLCKPCGASSSTESTEKEAADSWNRREYTDLRKLVEEMETHWRTGGLTPTRKNDLLFWWQKAKQLLQSGE